MERTRVVLAVTVVVIILALLGLVGLLGLGATLQANAGNGHMVVCPHDGDVNQDGTVTPSDALLAFQYFLGLAAFDACQQDRANVSIPERAAITPGDALCIFQSFLALPSCLDMLPPIAHAGADQTVGLESTVQLDGSGSSDVRGQRLTFTWAVTAAPAGSTATLSDPTAVRPTMVVDRAGDYVVELTVHNGTVASVPATVLISTVNSPPVAQAGPAQTVQVAATVQLDGRSAHDVDGDTLTYTWTILDMPRNSTATLADPTGTMPTFVADRPGYYAIQLLVEDGGRTSAPSVVVISTLNSRPVAVTGVAQPVSVGDTVPLEGSGSHDADGDTLRYRWTLTVLPAGSTATLSDPTTAAPTFVADQEGTYVAQLIIHDGKVSSVPATVAITTANRPPALTPIGNQTVLLGNTLMLQLTATDPEADTLRFTLDSLPAHASLEATTGRFTFTPAMDQVGTLLLTFTVSDGHSTDEESITITITVPCQPPTIASVDPLTGPVGTVITITGTNLNCGAAPTLTLNGVPVVIASLSPTEIKTSIPPGGQDGRFAFTTSGGTVTVPQPLTFDVVLSQDFALLARPGNGQVMQGAATTYTVELQNVGARPFTGLTALAVIGIPSGVTASFAAPMLTSGQKTTLTVSAAATAIVGASTLTLQATGTVDATPVTRTASVMLDVQAGGRTAVVGQFTMLDGAPVAGVQLTLAHQQTQTDSGGNFQLLDVPEGTQTLFINATPADPQLPMYSVDTVLIPGQITQLPPFRLHPPMSPASYTPIQNATQDQAITNPNYPGASFTLPAGVTIMGWDGQPKTQMTLTRLNLDELPVPPPPGPTRSVFQPFFGTPMGGLPSAPIPVTLPNDMDLRPGDKAELWSYDAAPFPGVSGAWRFAGMGTVSQDGATIASDPGVGITRFCGVCGLSCFIARQDMQPTRNPDGSKSGDPVDLFLGQLIVEKTDLVLPGRMPVAIHRTYNPFDPFGAIAGFQLGLGAGWGLSVEVVLQEENPSLRRLILPGNARFAFALQGQNTFVNPTNPRFAGAVLTADTQGGHTLRFKNGMIWRFASGWLARVRPRPLVGLGLLIGQTDTNGNHTTIDHDAFGGITRLVDTVGREFTMTLDVSGLITDVTDPLGRTVHYSYDSAQRLATVTDPAGGVTRYTYDTEGRILTITDPKNIAFLRNTYGATDDGQVRLLRQEQADGGVWVFEYLFVRYDPCGVAANQGGVPAVCPPPPPPQRIGTRVVDPRGHATTYMFTPEGFTREITDALGQTTRFERDAGGRPLSTTDPLGRITRFDYDPAGNITRVINPAGNVYNFEYELPFNRLTKLLDPLGNMTLFVYDTGGDLIKITNSLGYATQIAYNNFGQPISITDPLGQITTLAYDFHGNLETIVDPLGSLTRRFYDAVSRLTAQTDPRGVTTRFSYDVLNRTSEIVDALSGVTSFTYDANGNLLTVKDALSHATTYEYDNMDQIVRSTDPANAHESFAYDVSGNLVSYTDRKAQASIFVYDALNRRIEAYYDDSTTASLSYDAVGRLVHISDTVDDSIRNNYDALDRLTQQTTARGTISYIYDALGRQVSMQITGQAPITYNYDASTRLTQITQGNQVATFTYDALSRRTQLALPNGVVTDYSYDEASNLTELIYRNPTNIIGNIIYQYDPTGNRIRVNGSFARTLLPAPIASAFYDAANRQLTFNTAQMIYDANGNLLDDGTKNYSWDARNRLIGISGPNLTASFQYDAMGRRGTTIINGISKAFLYDNINPVQEQVNGIVAAHLLTGLEIDEYLVRSDAAGSRTFVADAIGSTVVLLDSSGSVQTTYMYDPFGNAIATGEVNAFQYTRRENDQTGLMYYRARYYNPQNQRFISEDPLGFVGGINFYTYVNNNPINFIDPLGLWAGIDDLVFSGGGAIVGLAGQGLSDLISGDLSGWEDYLGSAIGGAAGGESLLYIGPFGAGAVAGAATNLSKQGLKNLSGKQCGFDPISLLADTGLGVATGFIPGIRIPGITAGRGSYNAIYKQIVTKFENGTISNISTKTAAKIFIGSSVDQAPGAGAGAIAGASGLLPSSERNSPCKK